MKFGLRKLGMFAACLASSLPAAAHDGDIPLHAERFVRAVQEQRFDEAAAMFTPGENHAPARIAAQLKRLSVRLGGFPTMRNVLSLPDGSTLMRAFPPVPPAARPNSYHQLKYTAVAADGQPVFYILTLDARQSHAVLWFEVQLPTPDAASVKRAEEALRDI